MKDGLYDFRFVALDHDRSGRLRVCGNRGEGSDGIHVFDGQVSRAGTNLMASFEVGWQAQPEGGSGPRPAAYTLKMFGTGTETDFNLIGLAPLGLIVELTGRWREPLAAGDDTAVVSGGAVATHPFG